MAQDSTAVRPPSPFDPDTVLAPAGGLRVVLLRTTGQGVAALRLSIPLQEGPAEAGAGRILRALALEKMESLARPVGARVAAARTPWGLAYSVEGAAADFEYLAYLLREAVAEPVPSRGVLADARLTLGEEAARFLETPRGRLAADLRHQVAPSVTQSEGTPATVAALDQARIRDVWRRSHQASSMTLVVSAPVVPEVILAVSRTMGSAESDEAPPLDAPALPSVDRSNTQSIRSWYGEAFPGEAVGDVHGPVVALLVADRLRQVRGDYETSVELWEFPDQWVLTILGAAYPGKARPMSAAVTSAVAGTLEGIESGAVEIAVARIRRSLLLGARTPAGLVEAVGRAMEATGDAGGAARQAEALDRVDVASVRQVLGALLQRGPARAEVGR
jgi:predicted Zn-dependent peptidase